MNVSGIVSAYARKAATWLLALVLAFGTAVAVAPSQTAFADAGEAGNLVITGAGTGKYKVYQLLTGDYVGTTYKISGVQVNAENESILVGVLKEQSYLTKDSPTAEEIADAIEAIPEASRMAFANALAVELATSGTAISTVPADDGTLSISGKSSNTPNGLPAGYYLVMADTTDPTYQEDGQSMTSAMLVPLGAGGFTGAAKVDVPTLVKKIKDSEGEWDKDFQDVADAGLVGGAITKPVYELTGTMPSNIADYTSYKYIFTDVLPTGVDVTESEIEGTGDTAWGVTIMAYKNNSDTTGTAIKSAFTPGVKTDDDAHTSTITWTCNDIISALKAVNITSDLKDVRIVIEYKPVFDASDIERLYSTVSTLDSPQVNTAKLTYSNNPYAGGDGTTSDTPDDTTKLYSYNLVINKLGEDGKSLLGAKFTLTDAQGNTVGKDITADDTGTFTFTGLNADVEYTITETQAPTDHKKISPIKIKITATPAEDGQTVESISVTKTEDPSNAATVTASSATITAKITNVEGQSLFNTGQEGIYVGLAVGGLALALSVAALIKRRRDQERAEA